MLLAILMENAVEETDAVRGLDRAHILLDALHQGEDASGMKETLDHLCGIARVLQADGQYRMEPPSMQSLTAVMEDGGACCRTDRLMPEAAEKAAAVLLDAPVRRIQTSGKAARIVLPAQFEETEENNNICPEAEETASEETGAV